MTTELQVYTPEKIELIRNQLCPKASDGELALFIAVAERTGLDPFTHQIRAIKRWSKDGDKLSIEIGMDGWRLIAERTGRYRGNLGPEWCGPDGVWQSVWLHPAPPMAARYAVLVEGWTAPCWGTALYRSYAATGKDGKPMGKWVTMPEQMLALAAERQAIRRAFPNETIGIPEDGESLPSAPTPTDPPREIRVAPASVDLPWPERKAKALSAIESQCNRLGLQLDDVLRPVGDVADDAGEATQGAWRSKVIAIYRSLESRPTPEEVEK